MTPTPDLVTETPCHRSYFYVGGQYVAEGQSGRRDDIHVGQMYVEHLTPVAGVTQPYAVVFIHGAGQTGTNWLHTPDGRPGWCSYLLRLGYGVYTLDLPSRGRSPHHDSLGPLTSFSADLASSRWTACSRQQPLLWPHASKHTQWPGSGVPGDPVFDAYYASMGPNPSDSVRDQTTAEAAGNKLLERIASPVILLTHSQGGIHGWVWADRATPGMIKAIVAIEPSGPPFVHSLTRGTKVDKKYGLTDIPLTYERFDAPAPSSSSSSADEGGAGEEPVRPVPAPYDSCSPSSDQHARILQAEPALKLSRLSTIPILIITGEASAHAAYDAHTARFLQQAGVQRVKHVQLAEDAGIRGNGHLMFLEKNNMEIIALVERWITEELAGDRSSNTDGRPVRTTTMCGSIP